jgi:hypothetical protein
VCFGKQHKLVRLAAGREGVSVVVGSGCSLSASVRRDGWVSFCVQKHLVDVRFPLDVHAIHVTVAFPRHTPAHEGHGQWIKVPREIRNHRFSFSLLLAQLHQPSNGSTLEGDAAHLTTPSRSFAVPYSYGLLVLVAATHRIPRTLSPTFSPPNLAKQSQHHRACFEQHAEHGAGVN